MEVLSRSEARSSEGGGAVVVRRLHRLVRHGYIPLLGYDVASGQDRDIRLHRKGATVILHTDGAVRLERARRSTAARTQADGVVSDRSTLVAADDVKSFDALFPPDTPNKRNVVRRLYEMGVGSR